MQILQRHTHSDRLERWLGAEQVERISLAMRDWHGPPSPIVGVPGNVVACRGGDFRGAIDGGFEASLAEIVGSAVRSRATAAMRRLHRAQVRWAEKQQHQYSAGFASISDLISEATAQGKRNVWLFNKAGTTGVVGATNSLWRVGNQPAAGAAAAAVPGGTVPTSASTGAFAFSNVSPDTQHIVSVQASASAVNTLILYDRIFAVAKTMNSTAIEAVTGAPTRYQSSTATDPDYSGGNFLFIECGSALAATAHNWTTCLYTDQDGNTGATLPSVTGNSACIVNRLDMPINTFFCPLASGDTGIKALTQMQCSAAVATGTIDFVIGHKLAFVPFQVANVGWIYDGILSAFNLGRVFDDACLAFLELTKPATSATTYNGTIETVYG